MSCSLSLYFWIVLTHHHIYIYIYVVDPILITGRVYHNTSGGARLCSCLCQLSTDVLLYLNGRVRPGLTTQGSGVLTPLAGQLSTLRMAATVTIIQRRVAVSRTYITVMKVRVLLTAFTFCTLSYTTHMTTLVLRG